MASKNNQILNKTPEEWRKFKYTHGSVSMNMDLRVDIKDQLKSAIVIAEDYLADLKKALEEVGKKKV